MASKNRQNKFALSKLRTICLLLVALASLASCLLLGLGDLNPLIRITLILPMVGIYSGISAFIARWDRHNNAAAGMSLYRALFYILVGILLTYGFCAFSGSLLTIKPALTFSDFKFITITDLQLVIAPGVALVQIAILLICRRFSVRRVFQPIWMLLPIIFAGLMISAIAVLQSMPAARFESVLGVPPPPSAQ